MFGAKQFVYANIFLQFLNNFHHGHSMHYHHHILTVLFENCCPFTERKHPSRCHSYKKKKKKRNEIVSNLEEADKIYEKQQLTRRRTVTVEIIRECFKEVKHLSYLFENGDTPDNALGYMTSIRRLLKGSVPPKSSISLEPTKLGPKRKGFLYLPCH